MSSARLQLLPRPPSLFLRWSSKLGVVGACLYIAGFALPLQWAILPLLVLLPITTWADVSTGLEPVLECVEDVSDDEVVAFFGYQNRSSQLVTIPIGDSNRFAPGPADQAQPVDFQPGRHRNVLSVPFSRNGELAWT